MMVGYDMLRNQHCRPYKAGEHALGAAEIAELLQQLDGWKLGDRRISKTFEFNNHYQVIAFVNAVAWMTHREDHHPDLHIGYNRCRIEYTTHAIGGLSANDFICAAKVDALYKQ